MGSQLNDSDPEGTTFGNLKNESLTLSFTGQSEGFFQSVRRFLLLLLFGRSHHLANILRRWESTHMIVMTAKAFVSRFVFSMTLDTYGAAHRLEITGIHRRVSTVETTSIVVTFFRDVATIAAFVFKQTEM